MITAPHNLNLGTAERRLLTRAVRTLRQAAEQREDYVAPREAPAAATLQEWAGHYLPHYFTLPASEMHRWLFEVCDRSIHGRGMKINCVGPRESAKSTVTTTAHVLREAVEGREPLIWIISEVADQSNTQLQHIKSELESNEGLRRDYPDACGRGPVWRKGMIKLRNGVAIEAIGKGAAIRGRRERESRPTLIVCDDLQSNNVIESAARRKKDWDWFTSTLLKAGSQRSNFFNLANAIHREAIGMRLTSAPGWESRTFSAITHWPTNMQLWAAWESVYLDTSKPTSAADARARYDAQRDAMDFEAKLLWPERASLYELMCMRAESHSAFEREKQSRAVTPEGSEWPEHYFEDVFFDAWPDPRAIRLKIVALDPSLGQTSKSDYSAYVKLALDFKGTLFVEADLARRDPWTMVRDGLAINQDFQPNWFGVETNQFQAVLAGMFEEQSKAQGLMMPIVTINSRESKRERIRRDLTPYLARKEFRFKRNSPGTMLLLEQLREFPSHKHDDGPDALQMALALARDLFSKRDSQ